MIKILQVILFLTSLALLSACGGGGGGGTNNPPTTYSTVKVKLATKSAFSSYTSGFASLQATLSYPMTGVLSIGNSNVVASGTMAESALLYWNTENLSKPGEVLFAALPNVPSSTPKGYVPYSIGEFTTLTFALNPAGPCPTSNTFLLSSPPNTEVFDINVNSINQVTIFIQSVTCS